jgi:hypothetical protein
LHALLYSVIVQQCFLLINLLCRSLPTAVYHHRHCPSPPGHSHPSVGFFFVGLLFVGHATQKGFTSLLGLDRGCSCSLGLPACCSWPWWGCLPSPASNALQRLQRFIHADFFFCFLAPFMTKIYVWILRNFICKFGPFARHHRLWRRGNIARCHSLWRRALTWRRQFG